MSAILSVLAVNTLVSFKLKNDPKLRGIAVKGEISDISVSLSGVMYFTLCDESASLRCVMFERSLSRLGFYPEKGMSVIAFGGIDVYQRGGIYQLNCTQLVPDGSGSDAMRLKLLKEELAAKGIFSKPKKQLPAYPRQIAVVTSPAGAAIHDIKSVVKRRFPCAVITLYPAVVQGASAPLSIKEAMHSADSSGADVIILTRGGGSNEDLSCFNTKEAVMAVYSCTTPVISAIGHEIDTTLCDLAADMRAATPTAAAELATPDIKALEREITALRSSVAGETAKRLYHAESLIAGMVSIIKAYSPGNRLEALKKDALYSRSVLPGLLLSRLSKLEAEALGYTRTLKSLNPYNVLSRGYAIIERRDGIVADSSLLKTDDSIKIRMRDGFVHAVITDNGDKD